MYYSIINKQKEIYIKLFLSWFCWRVLTFMLVGNGCVQKDGYNYYSISYAAQIRYYILVLLLSTAVFSALIIKI